MARDDMVWVCTQCGRQQPGQEMQCVCGNIYPEDFEERDIYNSSKADQMKEQDGIPVEEEEHKEQKVEKKSEEPVTMEDKTPHEELKADTLPSEEKKPQRLMRKKSLKLRKLLKK